MLVEDRGKPDVLELVSHLMWVLGMELWASVRAVPLAVEPLLLSFPPGFCVDAEVSGPNACTAIILTAHALFCLEPSMPPTPCFDLDCLPSTPIGWPEV